MKKLLYALLLFGCVQGCKDDCPTDPCEGQQKFEPHFDMITGIRHWSGELFTFPKNGFRWDGYPNNYILFEGDTLMTSEVYFRAPSAYDSVKWLIGDELEFRYSKDLPLYFEDFYPQNLPIQMIGYRTPNAACFPEEQAIDTVKRYLTLVPMDSSKLLGKWIGAYNTEPNDSFEIEIMFSDAFKNNVIMDRFPNRDETARPGTPQYSRDYHISIDQIWSKEDVSLSCCLDKYNRKYKIAYLDGKVFGEQAELLTMNLKYRYDTGPNSELFDITFNARKK